MLFAGTLIAVTLLIYNFSAAWPVTWFSLIFVPLALWAIQDQAEHDAKLVFESIRSAAADRNCPEVPLIPT